MTRVKATLLVCTLYFLTFACVLASGASPRLADAKVAATASWQGPSDQEAVADASGIPPRLTGRVRGTTASEERILKAIAEAKPSPFEKLTPAIIGLVGVLVGGTLGFFQQRRQLAHSLKMLTQQSQHAEASARAKSGYESRSKSIDFRSRQLNEFYYPLKHMLRQTYWVREQLCKQLIEADKNTFFWSGSSAGAIGRHLHVRVKGNDGGRLRLVQHMALIARHHRNLMPLVTEIVSIGEGICKLLHEKGGLILIRGPKLVAGARHATNPSHDPETLRSVNSGPDGHPGDVDAAHDLSELVGRYLAHYRILKDVTRRALEHYSKVGGASYNITYPNELDAALVRDIGEISAEMEGWRSEADAMWTSPTHAIAVT